MKRRSQKIDSDDYVVVDFKGVGSRRNVAAGDYRAIVTKITKGISKPGNPKLDWVFTITTGPEQGHRFQPYVTSLLKTSLWKLRATLEALGVEVPEEPLQIVFSELKGLELGLSVEHETYEHKVKERIVDLFPLEELGEEEEEEEGKESVVTLKGRIKEEEALDETPLGKGPDVPEVMKREEAAKLAKEAEEIGKEAKIKIEEETEEEEEEEEEDE